MAKDGFGESFWLYGPDENDWRGRHDQLAEILSALRNRFSDREFEIRVQPAGDQRDTIFLEPRECVGRGGHSRKRSDTGELGFAEPDIYDQRHRGVGAAAVCTRRE